MMRSRVLMMFLLLVTTLGFAPGCASECKQVRTAYQEALDQETALFEKPAAGDAMPVHLGVAVRQELLNRVLDQALRASLDDAISFADDVPIAKGRNIRVQTQGKVAELEIYPDRACETCLRVEGRLQGDLGVKAGILPSQTVPLRGSFTLVAPLKFARAKNGGGAVQLDLEKMVELGKSHVDPMIAQLPPSWSKALQGPLSKTLLEEMARSVGAVTLFRYDPPDLGVEGLEVLPAKLVSDADNRVIFAGFTTNLRGLDPNDAGIAPVTALDKNDNIAVAVHPAIVVPAVTQMIRSGAISRTYTREGEASKEGPFHVTLSDLSLRPGERGPSSFALDFRLWHLPPEESDAKCYWADATATGRIEVVEDRARAKVDDIEMTESSLPGVVVSLANWTSAAFLSAGQKAIERSLSTRAIEVPGGQLNFTSGRLTGADGAVVLRGKVSLSEAKK